MDKKKKILYNIKELYEWAIKNNCEEYVLYVCDEGGIAGNVYISAICIDKKKEEITL